MNYPSWLDLLCPYCCHKEDKWIPTYIFEEDSFYRDADGCTEPYSTYSVEVYHCPNCKQKIQAYNLNSFDWYYKGLSLIEIGKDQMSLYGWSPYCFFLVKKDNQPLVQVDVLSDYYNEQSLNLVIDEDDLIDWDKTLDPIKPPSDLWSLLI